ncbi:MAG: hypothetical protein ACREL5_03410 [Gemmatimonadales bacterium]
MSRLLATAMAVALLSCTTVVRPIEGQATRPDSEQQAMKGIALPLGIPHARIGSGTSWVPDGSVHRDYQRVAGPWMLVGHGAVDVYYDHQGTVRGGNQLGSTNWLMGMAMRQAGGGVLEFNAMVSAEPLTVGSRGYPLLLQTGESYQGQPLHDRQHPHDLFMELSASFAREIGHGLAVTVYLAPVGEPALGPVAFMHRPSAQSDPFAPIAHHWQDATHITHGVGTIGIYSRVVKLEGSIFNGREPDENRYDIEFHPLDSWSARLDVNPAPQWSLNASYGFLKSPEALAPDESQHRISASVMRSTKLGPKGQWAVSLIYGANQHQVRGGPDQPLENSFVAESNVQLDDCNTVFGRLTWVQKTAAELVVADWPPDQRFTITNMALGYARELARFGHTALSIGVRGEVGLIPAALKAAYGSRSPAGIAVFARLRPMPSTGHSLPMSMPMESGSRDAPVR